jgi:hypothetical protein
MRVAMFAIWILVATLAVARADGDCNAPLADWQPRDALVAKLQAEGWQDVAIRVHDGCYLVRAFKAEGGRLHGKFDPATLAPMADEHGRHGDEGRGRHGDDGHGRQHRDD